MTLRELETMATTDSMAPIEGETPIEISDEGTAGNLDIQDFADEVADLVDAHESVGFGSEANARKARVAELEEALSQEENKYKRLLADFQNMRNRASREVQAGVEQAEKQILLELLQVLDSFNRCLNSSYQSIEDFRTGVNLIEKQFLGALRRLRVSEIETKVGDMFDAHVAEALTAIDTTEFPAGSIVDICERGYKIGDRLLRPARVVVARGGDSRENIQ